MSDYACAYCGSATGTACRKCSQPVCGDSCSDDHECEPIGQVIDFESVKTQIPYMEKAIIVLQNAAISSGNVSTRLFLMEKAKEQLTSVDKKPTRKRKAEEIDARAAEAPIRVMFSRRYPGDLAATYVAEVESNQDGQVVFDLLANFDETTRRAALFTNTLLADKLTQHFTLFYGERQITRLKYRDQTQSDHTYAIMEHTEPISDTIMTGILPKDAFILYITFMFQVLHGLRAANLKRVYVPIYISGRLFDIRALETRKNTGHWMYMVGKKQYVVPALGVMFVLNAARGVKTLDSVPETRDEEHALLSFIRQKAMIDALVDSRVLYFSGGEFHTPEILRVERESWSWLKRISHATSRPDLIAQYMDEVLSDHLQQFSDKPPGALISLFKDAWGPK